MQKTGGFARNLPYSACKICFRVALSSIVPAHFPNQISKGLQLNSQKHGQGCGLMLKNIIMMGFLHTSCLLVSCLVSCNRVAASRIQIVSKWLPVACKLYPHGRQLHANFCPFYSCCMRLAATRAQFACDWRPLGYNLYATGRQSHTQYTVAHFACTSGQLCAKPPVFCKHTVRTII